MNKKSESDLRELFQRTIPTIGPVRSKSVELLLSLAISGAGDDGDGSHQRDVDGLVAELKEASAILNGGMAAEVAALDYELPKDVQASAQTIGESLKKFLTKVDAALALDVNSEDRVPSLVALEKIALDELRGPISDFLVMLGKFVDNVDLNERQRDRELVSSAIAQIDHISTSINLISVNASVEAARAGEVGRGFAVIAAEIQSLSAQSKQAVDGIRAGLSR